MNSYLSKHAFCSTHIHADVEKDLFLVVVIPCYNESRLVRTLQSLADCHETKRPVDVIIVINSGESDDSAVLNQNLKTMMEAEAFIRAFQKNQLRTGQISFHPILIKNLPSRHAGVGLARKIGMDEAVRRLEDAKNPEGVIVCLDADCTVDKNYLTEIESHFLKNHRCNGCSVYFEHPLEGDEFPDSIYRCIINYELFLRYYRMGLEFSGFPYPFYTIGSCMAVKNRIYRKQGGMNRRKAGEDFYFLHKIFPLGNFDALNSTRVIPSPRASDRVPFGTGRAQQKFMNNAPASNLTYNARSFIDLKILFNAAPAFYSSSAIQVSNMLNRFPESIKTFLTKVDFERKLNEVRTHCSSQRAFTKRFFNWVDGFMVLKFIHHARDNFYPQQPIPDAAKELLNLSRIAFPETATSKSLLMIYRSLEREKSG